MNGAYYKLNSQSLNLNIVLNADLNIYSVFYLFKLIWQETVLKNKNLFSDVSLCGKKKRIAG